MELLHEPEISIMFSCEPIQLRFDKRNKQKTQITIQQKTR